MAENSPFQKGGKVDLEPLAGNEAVAGLLESRNIKGTRTTTYALSKQTLQGIQQKELDQGNQGNGTMSAELQNRMH